MEPAEIRSFRPDDEAELLAAYSEVVEDGGAFPRRAPADGAMLHSAWLEGATTVQIARLNDGRLAGSYFLRPAYPDAASHIANAGYLVPRKLRGQGIGTTLARHSLDEARDRGFDAMLFTLVLEGNPSRRLWQHLGFDEVGRIPQAVDGEDALLYWRPL